jgi:uncharacterized damage-inducible protein DinB
VLRPAAQLVAPKTAQLVAPKNIAGPAAGRDDVRVTWTVPEVTRPEPPLVAGERESLDAWLDFHRDTLLRKCAGLTAGQLRQRSVPPSSLSLLGLVRHMTDVERWWFRIHGTDQDMTFRYSTDHAPDAEFNDLDSGDAQDVLAAYRDETELARAAVRGKSLDEVVPSHGHHRERVRDLRWIYLHMIEEYARHNGHADLIRERIDGVTGD